MSSEYNGWTNWATWQINRWLGHNGKLAPGPFTANSAEDFVVGLLPNGTPDMDGPEGYDAVNWAEIAEAWNADA